MLTASVSVAQNARIVLRWKEVPGAPAYELQIAKDPAFVEIVLQTRTTSAGYRWEQLPTTAHWWRVRSFDAESRASEWSLPRTISVDSAVPTPVKPADGVTLACGATVVFEVEPSVLMKEYLVELSSTADFAGFRTLRSSSPVFEVPGLVAGAWWWRTRGVDIKARTSGPGPTRSLTIRVGAPKLKPVADVPLGTPQVQLGWSESSCAKSYLVEATQDGRDKVSFPVEGLSMAFKAGMAGEYRWRVASVDERGNLGEFSPESAFRVRLPSPIGRSESVSSLRAEVSWSAVPTAVAYKVELLRVGAAGRNENVAAATVSQTSWKSSTLPPGQYQWRVVAKDALGHTSAPSEFRTFTRSAGTPLERTRWLSLQSDAVVGIGAQVELAWSEVPERREFEVEVDGASIRVTAPVFRTAALNEGAHQVRVRAVGDGFRFSEWSEMLELYAGVPPVVRAEVVLVGEQVQVHLMDARGRTVEGAPTFAMHESALTAAEWKDGRWEAQWAPPASGSDVLRIDERDFHFEQPLVVSMDPFMTVAVRAGGIFNGGAIASPAVNLGFTMRLPWFRRRPGLEFRVGGFRARNSFDVGGAVVEAQAWLLPLSLVAAWHQNVGAFQLKGGAGPVVQLAWVQVGGDAAFAPLAGVEVLAALSRRIGPGRVEVEVAFLHSQLHSVLARLYAGGVAARVGYALDF